jgi:hypothetical protein
MDGGKPTTACAVNAFFAFVVVVLIALDLVAMEAFVTRGAMSPLMLDVQMHGDPAELD